MMHIDSYDFIMMMYIMNVGNVVQVMVLWSGKISIEFEKEYTCGCITGVGHRGTESNIGPGYKGAQKGCDMFCTL